MSDPTQPPQHGGTPTPVTDTEALIDNLYQKKLNMVEILAELQTYSEQRDRQLTAALDEKREVEGERETAINQRDSLDASNTRLHLQLHDLKERLALAEGLAEALKEAQSFIQVVGTEDPDDIETIASIESMSGRFLAILSRWAESRTEGTCSEFALSHASERGKDVTVQPPDDPASRAVPITPETVVPFPCWLWHPESATVVAHWRYYRTGNENPNPSAKATHYHPDQPTPPTSRPT